MSCYFSSRITVTYDEALEKAAEVLNEEGFGILTRIDVRETVSQVRQQLQDVIASIGR